MNNSHDPRRAAIAELVRRVPELGSVLANNIVDNFGDLIPTLFLADLLPWMVDRFAYDEHSVKTVLDWIEEQLAFGDTEVRGMIIVSGIDDLTAPGGRGEALLPHLGPLTASIDPWSTT